MHSFHLFIDRQHWNHFLGNPNVIRLLRQTLVGSNAVLTPAAERDFVMENIVNLCRESWTTCKENNAKQMYARRSMASQIRLARLMNSCYRIAPNELNDAHIDNAMLDTSLRWGLSNFMRVLMINVSRFTRDEPENQNNDNVFRMFSAAAQGGRSRLNMAHWSRGWFARNQTPRNRQRLANLFMRRNLRSMYQIDQFKDERAQLSIHDQLHSNDKTTDGTDQFKHTLSYYTNYDFAVVDNNFIPLIMIELKSDAQATVHDTFKFMVECCGQFTRMHSGFGILATQSGYQFWRLFPTPDYHNYNRNRIMVYEWVLPLRLGDPRVTANYAHNTSTQIIDIIWNLCCMIRENTMLYPGTIKAHRSMRVPTGSGRQYKICPGAGLYRTEEYMHCPEPPAMRQQDAPTRGMYFTSVAMAQGRLSFQQLSNMNQGCVDPLFNDNLNGSINPIALF